MTNSLTFLSQTKNFIKRHHLQIDLLKTIIDKNNIQINKLFNLLPSKNSYSDIYFEIELEIQELLADNEELQHKIEIIQEYYIVGFQKLKEKLISLNQHQRLYEIDSIHLYNHICKNIFELNFYSRVYLDSSFLYGLTSFTINILKKYNKN
ncbi:hypothetical protein PSOL_06920 [Candidatus Phytoplasma solani]|uniref:hypothetical protein n=1 Tax=Candidatus Phytoplasma solani TaxID=69896 RepID=UPI0032D9C69C